MSEIRAVLTRTLLPALAAAAISAGFGGSASASVSSWKPICAKALCLYKNPNRYSDGKMYYFITFKGSAVTHYNVRYHEHGGREVQIEVGTVSGSNQSGARAFRVQPGVKYTVRIQACNRGGLFQKSGCTGWYSIGFYGPT